MELKLSSGQVNSFRAMSFNRTFMELKWFNQTGALDFPMRVLIVPLWN